MIFQMAKLFVPEHKRPEAEAHCPECCCVKSWYDEMLQGEAIL